MFSATMPKRILKIAARHLNDPLRIEIAREVLPEGERPTIKQTAYIVARVHKVAALGRVLDIETPAAALVFCRTRAEVDQLTETLNGRGYRAEGLQWGMDQAQRDRVMARLRSGNAELLVATDVAARGLDIEHLHTSSTSMYPRLRSRMCIGLAASDAAARRALPSRLPNPVNGVSCAPSNGR